MTTPRCGPEFDPGMRRHLGFSSSATAKRSTATASAERPTRTAPPISPRSPSLKRREVALPGDKVLPWVFGVATNVLRNERRNRRRYKAALHRLPATLDEQDFADEATDRIDGKRRMCEALHLLGRLPHGERDVFVLAGWQALSPEDAAYALGISPGAARTRLSRARKRLALLTGTQDSASSLTTKGVELP